MKINHPLSRIIAVTILLVFVCMDACASNKDLSPVSIEIFSSNNSKIINLQRAYQRLTGQAQMKLQSDTINVLQTNHMEQGRFKDILGTYQMSTDQSMTADNSEIFYVSPQQQNLSDTQIFNLATKLANTLNQDSIAVFIPNTQSMPGEIIVHFTSKNMPSINDTVKMINSRLPATYAQAFSLRLNHTEAGFNHAIVESVEWLGSNIHANDIQKAFPTDSLTIHNGVAYLVYKDGHTQPL